MDSDALATSLLSLDFGSYQHCMTLHVSEDGSAVTLYTDTALDTYGEWIKGEGADICLYRCRETDMVVGVRLPLRRKNLAVFHDGPLKVNDGFLVE